MPRLPGGEWGEHVHLGGWEAAELGAGWVLTFEGWANTSSALAESGCADCAGQNAGSLWRAESRRPGTTVAGGAGRAPPA